MDRIVFLVEETKEQVPCLLNPETVTIRRWSGISEVALDQAPLSQNTSSDTPITLTGGGRTELDLDLLFDVDLTPPATPCDDVRLLTIPLWRLTENAVQVGDLRCIPTVWILWGRQWSVRCVIESIAERFELIGPNGAPRRSWVSLRARRVSDATRTPEAADAHVPTTKPLPSRDAPTAVVASGDGGGGGYWGARPDLLATELTGDPARWREVCEANAIDDPLGIPAGTVVAAPGEVAP